MQEKDGSETDINMVAMKKERKKKEQKKKKTLPYWCR